MINENELRKIDLNLLLVFSSLMKERSVTGAAQKLYLGQPAVSMALKRLRTVFNDQLFIREKGQLSPSKRAEDLYVIIEPALENLQSALRPMEPFDPATIKLEFKLGMYDDMEMALLPDLLPHLSKLAPGIDISVHRADLYQVVDLLEAQKIDIAVSHYRNLPKWAMHEVISQASFSTVFDRKTLPLKTPLSLDEFLEAEHLLVSFNGERSGWIDDALASIGEQRNISFITPHFASVPFILKGSPYVATLPTYVANCCVKYFGLTISAPPVDYELADISLNWHRRFDHDPVHRWVREQIRFIYDRVIKDCS